MEKVLKPRERRQGVEIRPAARELTGGVEQVVEVLQRILCIVSFYRSISVYGEEDELRNPSFGERRGFFRTARR